MSDQGTVSTEDTPPPRNAISVVTDEENKAAEASQTQAAPSDDESNTEKSAPSKTDDTGKKDDGKRRPRSRNRTAERKISDLTRQLEDATRVAEQQIQQIGSLEQTVDQLQAKTPAKPKPVMKDFKSPDEFGEAFAAWKIDAAPKKTAAKKAPEPAEKKQPHPWQAEIDNLKDAGEELIGEEFTEAFEDRTLPLSPPMLEFVLDSDRGPDLIMYLDEHRDEADEMRTMRPTRLAKKLAAIEKDLPARAAEKKPPAKKKAKAPAADANAAVGDANAPPGDPVGGENVGQAGVQEGMPMEDYAATRRKQEAAHRMK